MDGGLPIITYILRELQVNTLLIGVFAVLGLLRLDIDTDVVRSLPSGEKVIADGLDARPRSSDAPLPADPR